ncbi:FAD dependent oxidoreductase [Trichormus variabilis ATCC 29413]|uniref:Pyridine nucleotide-disulfide oxidoreductase domain-containing protein 2 n=2 Tax=Anabaena variabilis TaxID=264691 RepID=Q3MCT2_TRIV2|nr:MULTISPECIES: NAD(P)/FAD-dependent oxidoreductase [Nostocaceae]ABA21204.1 FAD dependent oxidoreductase [Trichormus variabilis ATCC 29413]MBC1214135.1 NAD(P)/FAD-dependent oxidoreductase [Trichormus variabilis ARAD]MBC1257885.1 NAD(P)/FAD-dependent oxidoreductase [Trichormus variabilis V5]MBC1267808.1 NAD(P)/FAD-dependent oxidoreductase [Trichormus variabilis FSR]MBC1303890.1 NAD(P)/FAD-dependent oxidoreductase [Trichormus variabilis N2B]
MQEYDVVMIGAGHNGLVCAAYLLKAGYSVLLLEKRSVPGGAATTEECLPKEAPGFKFNLCAIDHEFIHLGPVVEELELGKYGLEYLECDPVVFCPHPDGKYFLAHKSLEKTCAEIARYSERDAKKYAEFTEYWQRAIGAMIPMFNAPPKSIIDIVGNYDITKFKDLFSVIGSPNKTLDFIRNMLTSAEDILNEWFDSEFLKAPLARLASELGAPPSQKTIAIGAIMMAMRHNPGMARPRGGTGALIKALVNLVTSKGGVILTDQHVEKVLIDDGKAVGVRVGGGTEYRAKYGVISNIDAKRLFLQMTDKSDVDAADPDLWERLERRVVNNNETILKIDLALDEPLRFPFHAHKDEYLVGSILIADSVAHVEQAHSKCTLGEIPDSDPSMYVVMPSYLDPTLAPSGKHTVWIEFFAPYQIAGAEGTGFKGTGWTDELKNQVADKVVDKLATYAPNVKTSTIARRVESPAELGERLGAYKGNYYHIDMTLDQMVFFRPLPEIANYKTPIDNLFLTGAGTHPGGSISGMPGRNCARVFLQTKHPITQTLKDARDSIKSTVESVFGINQ